MTVTPRQSLQYRIVRTNLMVLVPILLLMVVTAITTIYSQIRQSNVELLTSESYNSQIYVMEQLASARGSQNQRELLVQAAPYLCKNLSNTVKTRIQIYDAGGEMLADSSFTQGAEATDDLTSALEGTKAYTFIRFNSRPVISFSSPIYNGTETIGAIRYLFPQDNLRVVPTMSVILLGVSMVALAITYAASSLSARWITEPVTAIKEAIHGIGEGKEEVALAPLLGETGEFRQIGDALITMQEQNKKAILQLGDEKEKQNLFFNSATHQLKTPLTSIIGYSEIIKRMSEDEDVVTSADYIEAAGKNLLETVENIISISRYKKAEYDIDPSWFLLGELCHECAGLLRPRLSRSGISLSNRCGEIGVHWDRQRLKEAVLNVLDNCILHSGCDEIVITTATWPVRLIIQDNGAGIPPEQLERVFEPFFRPVNAARGGSGLGLSICKSIMTVQGGDISVESPAEGGTRTILIFGKEKGPPPHRRRL